MFFFHKKTLISYLYTWYCRTFLDLTKTFDMVEHRILLNILYKCGFRRFIHKCFCSYLNDRVQRVRIDDKCGSESFYNIGVPQGSVLGHILFLVFINAVFRHKGCPTGFADDIAYRYSANSLLDLIADINHDLELLRLWFCKQ